MDILKTFIVAAMIALYSNGVETEVPIPDDIKVIAIQQICSEVAAENDIRPEVLYAVIEHESHYDYNAYNPNGYYGLMQISPKWHKKRMEKLNATDLFNPRDNIRVGCDYICELLEKNNGDPRESFYQYSGGSYEYADWVINKTRRLVDDKSRE